MILAILENDNTETQGQVCLKHYCFDVELAVTSEQRTHGLKFRRSMDFKKGMLFIFENQEKHGFWMKDTLIALDIIWINQNKEVVFISENAQPCRQNTCPIIKPSQNAKYVLEINGGISREIGLVVGDKISIEY